MRKAGSAIRLGRMWWPVAALAAALTGAAVANAQAFERIEIPPTADDPFTLVGYLARGIGDGPRAAIVALHGCDGLLTRTGPPNKRAQDWAARWTAAGYTVFMPESFLSRGVGPQCRVPLADRRAQPVVRARDVVRAADWLAAQPAIRPESMALVGWSHGGTTVLAASSTGRPSPRVDFKTAIAFYPGCRGFLTSSRWASRLPLQILIGTDDDWTPAAPCRDLAAKHTFGFTEYPGAVHGFDAPDTAARVLTGIALTADGTARIGTDPAARAAAIDAVTRILGDALR